MRLFIGIWPSDTINNTLIKVMHELKTQGVGGNYVPARNFHMTMVFLGEVPDAAPVKEAMARVKAEKFRLSLDGYGYFQDILYAGVKGNQKIKKYVSDLKKELSQSGIPCDKAKFEPHITLIRKMKGKRPAALTIPAQEMTVQKISLIKSEDRDGRRVYKEVFSIKV